MAIKFEVTADSSGFVSGMKKVQDTARETTKVVQQTIHEQEKTVEELTDRVTQLGEEIHKAEEAGDSEAVKRMTKEHEELSHELEEERKILVDLNKEYGKQGMDGQSQSVQSFRERLRSMKQELIEATIEFSEMSEEEQKSARGQELMQKIQHLTNESAKLADVMGDVNRAIGGVASDTRNWDTLAEGVNVATSAVGGLLGVASLFGAKEEELAEIQTKLQASLAISNALSVIQNNLQKESALMMGIRAVQEAAASKAIAVRTAAEGRGVIATMAATAAQKAYNLVAKANPYVLLATAILSVVGALYALSKGTSKAKKEAEELAKAEEEAEAKAKEVRESFVNASFESVQLANKISGLQTAYMKANTEFEKTRILKEAAAQFKSLGLECNNLNDAQRLLVKQGGQVIEMIRLQGAIAGLTAIRVDAMRRSYAAIYENNQDATYASILADKGGEVAALDAQIARYQARLGEVQSKLPMAKSSSTSRTSKSNTGRNSGGDKDMSEAEREAMRKKREREEAFAARELELNTAEARIKAMDEGTDKVIAQIWLDYNREMLAIEQSQEELRQKRIDAAKAAWEADPSTKGKDFWASDIYKTTSSAFTAEEIKYRAQREDAALMERERRLQEEAEIEQEAMRNYLKQYGDYQQQRQAITEEYDERIRKARTEGDKKMLEKQREAELEAVNERFGMVTQAMADLFADASKKSVKSIQSIIQKYEALINYLQGSKGKIDVDALKQLGLSEDDIDAVLTGKVSIKELTDRLKDLKGVLKDKSPYLSFVTDMKEAIKQIKDAAKMEDLGVGITNMASAIQSFLPALKEFGSNVATIFGADDSKLSAAIDGLDGLMTAGQGVGQVMSGDVVGGVMTAVKGVAQMVSAVDGMFGADWSRYNKMVEEYDGLIKVWDVLISKKKEYISESYGIEAYQAGEEARRLLANEEEAWRRLGREFVNTGASAGAHSKGVRMRKRMTDEDWSAVAASLGRSTDNYAGLGGRLAGLFDLTAEQLEKLRGDAPAFWAKLNQETQEYLNKIIDGADRLKEIEDTLKQQYTSTTFDSVYDAFKGTLSDMDKSAFDFSQDFQKYMFDAILNTKVDELFKERIQGWYDAFAKANEDGNIDSSEMASLRAEWEALGREGVELRETLRKTTGYGSSSEGSAVYNASKNFTQEQGDVLNGRMTAIQMGVRQEVILGEQIAANLKSMQSLVTNSAESTKAVVEIRNMMVSTNLYLDTIARTAKETSARLEQLDTITAKIREL